MVETGVVDALRNLRKTVASQPDDVDLRLDLIDALLDAGHAQSAWHHCIRILKRHPRHTGTLHRAHRAASAAGAVERARAYADQLAGLHRAPAGRNYEVNGRSWRLIRGGRTSSGDPGR